MRTERPASARPSRLSLIVVLELLLGGALVAIAVLVTPECPQERRPQAARRAARASTPSPATPASALPVKEVSRPVPDAGAEGEPPRYPEAWLPSRGDECHRYRGERVCEGPRKVPAPRGAPARLAKELGLGTRATASLLLTQEPPVEWTLAVKGRFTDAFRWPVEGGGLGRGLSDADGENPAHNGVDIGAPSGAPIRAVSDGLVAYSDNKVSGYGNLLMVIHSDGAVAMYGHCDAIYVFAGEQVRQGQAVAEVGSTAISRGSHLHFELRLRGEPVDPVPMFTRWKRRVGGRR